jgi:rod shape-determining protein MreC
MNKIGLFLLRFNGLFAFLVLEIFSLYLYFSQNATPEKTAFISSANQVVGNLYDYSNRWSRYWNLAAVNDSLAKENARLKMQLPSSQFSDLIDSSRIEDQYYRQQFKYTEAVIINNSINRPNNFITINRGSKHGVRANSGVVNGTGEGIIGIVRAVSSNYSLAMSLLHKDTRISSKIKDSGDFGVLVWKNNNDTRHMTLESIPKHAKLDKGDTIVTSGFSTIFPEGVMIGTVDSFYLESGSNFYTTIVALSADLGKVQYVYIVDDLMRDERQKLEEDLGNE